MTKKCIHPFIDDRPYYLFDHLQKLWNADRRRNARALQAPEITSTGKQRLSALTGEALTGEPSAPCSEPGRQCL